MQSQQALSLNRFGRQGLDSETGPDRVADAIVSAIGPGIHLKWTAGDQHLTLTDDGAPGLIPYFGADGVAMVRFPMDALGQLGIDLDADGAVCGDLYFTVGDDFRLPPGPILPPAPDRSLTAPSGPAGIPGIIISIPPVAGAIKPIPIECRIPAAVVFSSIDLIFYGGFGYRRTEIVVGLDSGADFFTQLHRFLGCLHPDLKFGLLIFFHPKRIAAIDASSSVRDLIDTERGIRRDKVLALQPAIVIRLDVL